MVDLAIVIVNYNVDELLRRCLRSVLAGIVDINARICVVDNDSTDDSVKMVKNEFPEIKLITNSQNVGYPAANNQGLRSLGVVADPSADRPRYSLLLNPDTEIPPDAFTTLIKYLDENQEVGVVGPKLILPDGKLDLACRRSFPTPEVSAYRMVGLSKFFPKSSRFGQYNMTYLDENQLAEVDSVVGAFMLVRTKAIAQVGLMDERFWMYGEDLDWAKRIKDGGWKIIYNPAITVLHVKRASSSQSQRAHIEFYRAMLIFYYKHYYQETPFLLHWLIIFGIAIKGRGSLYRDIIAGKSILLEKDSNQE